MAATFSFLLWEVASAFSFFTPRISPSLVLCCLGRQARLGERPAHAREEELPLLLLQQLLQQLLLQQMKEL